MSVEKKHDYKALKKKESVIAQQKFEQAAEMRDKERKLISKLKEVQEKW